MTDKRYEYSVVHTGTVVSVGDGSVAVKISSTEDCAGCAARSFCRTEESARRNENIVDVAIGSSDLYFSKGDCVEIGLTEGLHNLAVFLVFVLPTILLAGVILLSLLVWNLGDRISIVAGLGAMVTYDFILFVCFRHKIRKKYRWSVIRRL